jgi:hypothetical protein
MRRVRALNTRRRGFVLEHPVCTNDPRRRRDLCVWPRKASFRYEASDVMSACDDRNGLQKRMRPEIIQDASLDILGALYEMDVRRDLGRQEGIRSGGPTGGLCDECEHAATECGRGSADADKEPNAIHAYCSHDDDGRECPVIACWRSRPRRYCRLV